MSQWGTVGLANQGKSSYQILQNYFGNDIDIKMNVPVKNIEQTLPASPLKRGYFGNDVKDIQIELNRIRKNYPSIPLIYPIDAVFGVKTEAAVREFQRIFNLAQDGVVGKSTWYKIKQVYNGVKKLGELQSEGLTYEEVSPAFPTELKPGDTGDFVKRLQYYLTILRYNYSGIPPVEQTGVYDEQTADAVREFQRYMGKEPTGIADEHTIYDTYDQYRNIVSTFPPGFTGKKTAIYPGYYYEVGSEGEDVRTIKSYLAAIAKVDPNIPPFEVNDKFDQAFSNAVLAFQKEYGITPIGEIAALTWNKITEIYEMIQ